MDSWNAKQMASMQVIQAPLPKVGLMLPQNGGNDRARAFFQEYNIADISNLTQKYSSPPAMAYKAKIAALSNVFVVFYPNSKLNAAN